jgi:hypothetical protein
MKSLRGLIRRSALILMAALLLAFSVLVYAGGDALLRRFVDGRLVGLAETVARIVEQHPTLIEGVASGTPCLKPLSQSMARLFDTCSSPFPVTVRCGTFCRPKHLCACTVRHSRVL